MSNENIHLVIPKTESMIQAAIDHLQSELKTAGVLPKSFSTSKKTLDKGRPFSVPTPGMARTNPPATDVTAATESVKDAGSTPPNNATDTRDHNAKEAQEALSSPNPPPPPAPPVAQTDDTAPAAGELDAAGMPWDARIHSSAKTKTKKDGKWKYIRGVDKNLVAQVEGAVSAAPSAASTPTPPPAAPAGDPAGQQSLTTLQPDMTGYAMIAGKVFTLQNEGKLQDGQIDNICQAFSLDSLTHLSGRLDLVPAVGKYIDSILR